MKRITTMNLDVLTQKPKDCDKECLFITHLHEGRIRVVNKKRVRERYAKKYTQLAIMINPNSADELPDEVIFNVKDFHEKMKQIDLQQDREKTVKLIKFIIFELNKTIQEWNDTHKNERKVVLNLTIVFVYGDHLVMFNFGHNMVYIYRDGDLATFKGSRLDNEKHFSLKTGREGKIEYMLFEKQVPPIGEVDFETNQIEALFNITHRLLKGDMLAVLSVNSILPDKFRVNVNLFEHAIERPQMLRLINQSKNEDFPGYAWVLMTFDEVREFRQTVRYTLFRTVRGLLSFFLLLGTLIAPSIYQMQTDVDETPVNAFDTPPTTAHLTILIDDDHSLDLIPPISGSPEIVSGEAKSITEVFSDLLNSGAYPDLGSYYIYSASWTDDYEGVNQVDLADRLSIEYYNTSRHASLIWKLNPMLSEETMKSSDIYLPVFSVLGKEGTSLSSYALDYYGSETFTDDLKMANNIEEDILPYDKHLIIPPIHRTPLNGIK